MNQKEYEAAKRGESQADRILNRLTLCIGDWVEMPELARVSGAYAVHSRVADLRKRGHVIDQVSVKRGCDIHSFYRLVE